MTRALAIVVVMCGCTRAASEHPDPERTPPAPSPAVAPAPKPVPAPTPAPAPSADGVTIEYRSRGRFPTCRGNERIRIDAQGGVFHQVNDRDCERSDGWSAPYGAPRVTLSADERTQLASLVQRSGVLDLPAETVDNVRTGGRREELEIDIAGRHVVVAVDRTTVPAFTQVRQALIDLAAR